MTDFVTELLAEKAPVRFSNLKHMAKSPAHYRENMINPGGQTEAMRRGSYTHALVLGTADKWVQYDGVRRGKFWDAFQDDHPHQEIISATEAAPCVAIAAAVRRHEQAMALITGGVCEQTIDWNWLGRSCQGTPDVRAPDYIADLKTTRCSEPGRFVRDATFRAYHAQLAWYLDGANASGRTPRDAYVIAVESTPPYPVTVLKMTPSALDMGRRLCRFWMERLLACEEAERWPGYVEEVVDFDVSPELDLVFADEE